jgi:hypothetical protein
MMSRIVYLFNIRNIMNTGLGWTNRHAIATVQKSDHGAGETLVGPLVGGLKKGVGARV